MAKHKKYRLRFPVPAVAGCHGAISATVESEGDSWRWIVYEDEASVRHGKYSGAEDAQDAAIYQINGMLTAKGLPKKFVVGNKSDWLADWGIEPGRCESTR